MHWTDLLKEMRAFGTWPCPGARTRTLLVPAAAVLPVLLEYKTDIDFLWTVSAVQVIAFAWLSRNRCGFCRAVLSAAACRVQLGHEFPVC
jgi:hypothetical protein